MSSKMKIDNNLIWDPQKALQKLLNLQQHHNGKCHPLPNDNKKNVINKWLARKKEMYKRKNFIPHEQNDKVKSIYACSTLYFGLMGGGRKGHIWRVLERAYRGIVWPKARRPTYDKAKNFTGSSWGLVAAWTKVIRVMLWNLIGSNSSGWAKNAKIYTRL